MVLNSYEYNYFPPVLHQYVECFSCNAESQSLNSFFSSSMADFNFHIPLPILIGYLGSQIIDPIHAPHIDVIVVPKRWLVSTMVNGLTL